MVRHGADFAACTMVGAKQVEGKGPGGEDVHYNWSLCSQSLGGINGMNSAKFLGLYIVQS